MLREKPTDPVRKTGSLMVLQGRPSDKEIPKALTEGLEVSIQFLKDWKGEVAVSVGP